jgi:hypothetical protein
MVSIEERHDNRLRYHRYMIPVVVNTIQKQQIINLDV